MRRGRLIDERPAPVHVDVLRAAAVVHVPDALAQLVKKAHRAQRGKAATERRPQFASTLAQIDN